MSIASIKQCAWISSISSLSSLTDATIGYTVDKYGVFCCEMSDEAIIVDYIEFDDDFGYDIMILLSC